MATQSSDGRRRRRTSAGLLAIAALLGCAALLVLSRLWAMGSAGTGFVAPPQPRPLGGALRGGVRVTGAAAGSADGVASVVGGVSSAVLVAGAVAMVSLGLSKSVSVRQSTPRVVRCAKGTPLEELNVGDQFDGKVTRVAQIGIWLDIGAEKEALWPKMQLPKGAADKYKPGDTVKDLKIYELQTGSTPSERKIRVTLKESASGVEVGKILDGTVKNASKFGVFLDVGLSTDALAPIKELSQDPSAYNKGDKLKVKVIKVDGDRVTVSSNLEASAEGEKSSAKALASFREGQEVVGKVLNVNMTLGVFLDIGADRDALCRPNQLAKAIQDYKPGDEVTGLKISSMNLQKGQVEVTSRPLASEVKEGDKLEGTVLTVSKFGVFFDAGLATDVLVPNNLLAKLAEEYKPGEVADLVVTNVQGNRITATSKAEDEMGSSVSQFVRGSVVSGKITRINNNNVFLDVGALTNALWRVKDASSYKVGDEVQGLIVTMINPATNMLEVSSAEGMKEAAESGSPTKSLSEMVVGSVVDGTITRIMPFGIFVDVGAERDALWATNQLDKPVSEYQEGDTVTGIRITQSDPQASRLSVSFKKSAADYSSGEAVSGKVAKIMTFGVFVDIGASVDALAPASLLAKDPSEYSVGEELTDLSISQVDVKNNKISLAQAGAQGGGSGGGTVSMDDLKVGQKIDGIVRVVKDYGVFMDIGLGRKDALLPASLFGEAKPEDFKEGSKLAVFVAAVDKKQDRVSLSVDEPSSAASTMANLPMGDRMPIGFMIPDLKIWKARNTPNFKNEEDFTTEEPWDWHEMEKRHPDLIRIRKTDDLEMYFTGSNGGYGFNGPRELIRSQVCWMPIPVHLRKPDAGPAEIPDHDYDDETMDYDYGLKPEIHVKYRTPPMNDPNWTYRNPTAEDFARAERAKLQSAKSQVAQAAKDEE